MRRDHAAALGGPYTWKPPLLCTPGDAAPPLYSTGSRGGPARAPPPTLGPLGPRDLPGPLGPAAGPVRAQSALPLPLPPPAMLPRSLSRLRLAPGGRRRGRQGLPPGTPPLPASDRLSLLRQGYTTAPDWKVRTPPRLRPTQPIDAGIYHCAWLEGAEDKEVRYHRERRGVTSLARPEAPQSPEVFCASKSGCVKEPHSRSCSTNAPRKRATGVCLPVACGVLAHAN